MMHYAPVLSFNLEGKQSEWVGQKLNSMGIAVRAGLHCAPRLRSGDALRKAQQETGKAGTQRVPAFCAVCRQVLERKGVHAARRSPFRLPKSWSISLAPKTPHSSSSRSCRSLQRDGHLLFLVQHPPQSRAAHAKLDRRLTLIAVDSAQGDLYQFTGHLLQSTICVKHRGLGHGLRRL